MLVKIVKTGRSSGGLLVLINKLLKKGIKIVDKSVS